MNALFRTKLKNATGDSPLLLRAIKKAQGLRFALRYGKYYSNLGIERASTKEVNLEFSSACNLRCSFCALDHQAPKSYMSLEVLDRIIHDITTDKRFEGVERIQLHHGGETLMHQPHPLNSSWMHPDFVEVISLMDSVEFRRLHDWGGKVETGESPSPPNKLGCDLLMDQLVVFPGGNVSVCCNDLNGEGVLGNVLENDLYSIYSSLQRLEQLHQMMWGRKDQINLCKDCHSY